MSKPEYTDIDVRKIAETILRLEEPLRGFLVNYIQLMVEKVDAAEGPTIEKDKAQELFVSAINFSSEFRFYENFMQSIAGAYYSDESFRYVFGEFNYAFASEMNKENWLRLMGNTPRVLAHVRNLYIKEQVAENKEQWESLFLELQKFQEMIPEFMLLFGS